MIRMVMLTSFICIFPAIATLTSADAGKKATKSGYCCKINIRAFHLKGESAQYLTKHGLVIDPLEEVDVEVHLVNRKGEPLSGSVEIALSGGYFPDSGKSYRILDIQDGRVRFRFTPMKRIPSILIDFRKKGKPSPFADNTVYSLPVLEVKKLLLNTAPKETSSNGQTPAQIIFYALDSTGRRLPHLPFEVRYNSPDNKAHVLKGRISPDGQGSIRLPPSTVPGTGIFQVRVGSHFSEQGVVHFTLP